MSLSDLWVRTIIKRNVHTLRNFEEGKSRNPIKLLMKNKVKGKHICLNISKCDMVSFTLILLTQLFSIFTLLHLWIIFISDLLRLVCYCCWMNESYWFLGKWEGIPGAAIGSFPQSSLKGLFILKLGPGDKQLSGSAVWGSVALCRTLSTQRGSFWWLSFLCYHNQLLAHHFIKTSFCGESTSPSWRTHHWSRTDWYTRHNIMTTGRWSKSSS